MGYAKTNCGFPGERVMNVDGKKYRTIWLSDDGVSVEIIDQTKFPYSFETMKLHTMEDAAHAIRVMQVRGAPLIGATAAYGVALAMRENSSDDALHAACSALLETRPTAVNLHWALDKARKSLIQVAPETRAEAAFVLANDICDEDIAINMAIGMHGMELIAAIARTKREGEAVNILTHCNAGWLATVDWGTATAPVYMSHDGGIPVHVWVDETRPRNQGAFLTAWELGHHGVPHTVIVDNAGGHLMQHGEVDMVITGTDRTTATGDVCNKIGTYLKALAARDNDVPFYVALPSPTIDFSLSDGVRQIPIEERSGDEISRMTGRTDSGTVETINIVAEGSEVGNPAFDVTPARLVTGLITERGVLSANRQSIATAFPERVKVSA
jgi:methylthioribose-1-phosphate isomerase